MAKKNISHDELGERLGITAADKEEGFRRPEAGQSELDKAIKARGDRAASARGEIAGLADLQIGAPDKQIEGKIRAATDRFTKARTPGERNIHRQTAWDLAEGIRRDSGAENSGRRTRASFIPGFAMPCANSEGNCKNTVPYQGPKVEAEGSPVTAGITTCSGGKCDGEAPVATPTRSRE